jgi:hypothetical protein
MECFDLGDGTTSPMTFSAICDAKAHSNRVETYDLLLSGPTMRHLSTQDCLTYLCSRILKEGFDPDVKLPEAKSASQALLAGLIISQLRVSELTLMLVGIGVFEHDEAAISEWYKLCKALVGLANRSLPGSKPFRFLIISPAKSEAVNKIKVEFPGIPVLQVLTGAEFRQRYPTGLPKLDKKDKKDKKAKKKKT